MQPHGMHHVSAISAHISASHRFYTRALGMRPVIRTVNQDDASMYHLFFGDGAGTPGSDMTVFDIPGAVRERRGNNSISLSTLRVAGVGSLEYWAERLTLMGCAHSGLQTRDDRACLDFEDPEGTQLSLVDDHAVGEAFPWPESPVPALHQLRGLGYSVFTVPALEPTARFLTDGLGLVADHAYDAGGYITHVFVMADRSVAEQVHVRVRPDVVRGRHGAGGVHHFALRVSDIDELVMWREHLDALGYGNSGIVDRHYFTSLYVREPNGVLIELATDGPGFDVDGPLDGERLSLPPFLEPRRAEIESKLKPLDS